MLRYVCDCAAGAFGVLVSNGDGTFTDHLIGGPIVSPTDLTVVDINQDGLSDAIFPRLAAMNPVKA